MAKDKINYTVELYLGDVALTIWTDKKFKGEEGNRGYIEVGGYSDPEKNSFYDNLDFFLSNSKKDIREECEGDLEDKGFHVRDTLRTIRRLIKKALKKGLLTPIE